VIFRRRIENGLIFVDRRLIFAFNLIGLRQKGSNLGIERVLLKMSD